ncbi:MAG: 16S rRNA (guanine(527)-N(7))-methyltransferase RsmG [Leptonema sp. (in: bacteria)]
MDFFYLFDEYLKSINISLTKEKKELFYKFHKIFIKKNQELNLSRIYNLEEIIRKHYIDSLYLLPILERDSLVLKNPIMDLGTGAGFPGIPLAIAKEEYQILLVESRSNRVEYLKLVKKELGLSNIEIIHKTLNYKDRMSVNTVLTRALESIKETAIRTASSLEQNGYLIFYKGPNCLEEILEIPSLFFKKILEINYNLPQLNPKKSFLDQRKMIILQKLVKPETLLKSTTRKYFTILEKITFKEINSKENEFYKFVKKLFQSNGIKKYQFAVLAGKKIILECLQRYPQRITHFIFTKDLEEEKLKEFYNILKLKNPKVHYFFFSSELIHNLELRDYPSPYLIIQIPNIKKIESLNKKFLILPIQDPSNFGACVRSAYAFGITDIILTKESCHPFLLKSIRSSSGYVLDCNFYEVSDLVHFIESNVYSIYAFHTKGLDIRKLTKKEKAYGYLLGEEGQGLPESILNLKQVIPITIPMKHSVDSLNVSVSCGIGLFYLENLL